MRSAPTRESGNQRIVLRAIRNSDAGVAQRLIGQLGYRVGKSAIAGRIARIDPERRMVVVASIDDQVVGLISAVLDETFVEGWSAHIEGLIVEECARGVGIGDRLIAASERWALAKRCGNINVHCNVIRARAHDFYGRHGYRRVKSQHFLRKELRYQSLPRKGLEPPRCCHH